MNNLNYIYNQIPEKVTFPNSKNENWRYFNLRELKTKLNQTESVKNAFLISYTRKINTHLRLDNESLFLNEKLPDGISIDIVNPKDFDSLDAKIQKNIGKIARIDSDYFISENTQKFSQLILIKVKENYIVRPNLELDINVSEKIGLNLRFFIYSEKKSSSSIQINWNNSACNINSVFEFYLDKKSNMNLVITNNGENSVGILNYSFQIEEKSNLKTTFISLGKQILKNDIRIDLGGEKAEADIGGLYIAKPKSIIDYNIIMNHLSKGTLSKQFFKGILSENSKASFTGRVKIEKNCIDSKSEQINNNLLLSEKAQINSDPQLEIYCNEVECSHASTVGQFDEDILFYLRSRGISKEYARKMLLEGFYMDILNRINNPKIQSIVEANIL